MKDRKNTVFVVGQARVGADIALVALGTLGPVTAYFGVRNGRRSPNNTLHKAFNKNRSVRTWLASKGYEFKPDRGHPWTDS